MATTASTGAPRPRAMPAKALPPKDKGTNQPDVEEIMAGIRRTARERAEEGGKTEREFKADLRKRMLQPLARGFTDDFAEGVRSRDQVRWNIGLKSNRFHGSSSAPMRVLRRLFSPLTRLLLNLEPVVELAARQAEINEYHRRLLWVTSRDLEVARLELDLVKRELRRLGVNAEFSFGAGSGAGETPRRSGAPSGGRGEGRGGRQDRGRSGGRRPNTGRGPRNGGGRREAPASRPAPGRAAAENSGGGAAAP